MVASRPFRTSIRYFLRHGNRQPTVRFIQQPAGSTLAFDLSCLSTIRRDVLASAAVAWLGAMKRSAGDPDPRPALLLVPPFAILGQCTSRPSIPTTTSARSREPTCSSWRRSCVGFSVWRSHGYGGGSGRARARSRVVPAALVSSTSPTAACRASARAPPRAAPLLLSAPPAVNRLAESMIHIGRRRACAAPGLPLVPVRDRLERLAQRVHRGFLRSLRRGRFRTRGENAGLPRGLRGRGGQAAAASRGCPSGSGRRSTYPRATISATIFAMPLIGDPETARQLALTQLLVGQAPEHVAVRAA